MPGTSTRRRTTRGPALSTPPLLLWRRDLSAHAASGRTGVRRRPPARRQAASTRRPRSQTIPPAPPRAGPGPQGRPAHLRCARRTAPSIPRRRPSWPPARVREKPRWYLRYPAARQQYRGLGIALRSRGRAVASSARWATQALLGIVNVRFSRAAREMTDLAGSQVGAGTDVDRAAVLIERLRTKRARVAVIGLGYVG